MRLVATGLEWFDGIPDMCFGDLSAMVLDRFRGCCGTYRPGFLLALLGTCQQLDQHICGKSKLDSLQGAGCAVAGK